MTHAEDESLDLRQRRTRQSLVRALEELLAEQTFQSLSVTDICQRAMVHRTTFYAHFNDKQELLRYLLLGVERRCVETCLPKDWSGEARDYFLTAARNVLDFFQSRRSLYRACLRSGADIDAHVLEDQAAEDLVQLLSQPRFHTAFPDPTPASPPGSTPAPCCPSCAGGWTAKIPSPWSVSSPTWSTSFPHSDQEDPIWIRKSTPKPS